MMTWSQGGVTAGMLAVLPGAGKHRGARRRLVPAGGKTRGALGGAIVGALALLALAAPADAAGAERCGKTAEEIYGAASGAVVEIFSLTIDQFRVDHRVLPSFGTGFRTADGLYLTNYHVVADAKDVVIYADDLTLSAEIVALDPILDLAVLRELADDLSAPAEPAVSLPHLDFADPASLALGEPVWAVGYPMGLGKTVTQGILTGLQRVRRDTTTSWMSPMLQTDATVNPGNSGGPLLDDCGKVVGMVARQIPPARGENTAFAIPVDILAPAISELKAKGKISRPWHGLYGQMTTPPILMILGVPFLFWEDSSGFLVETVEPGSAADQIGLKGGVWPVTWGGTAFLLGGDIITEVNGTRITDRDTALDVVRNLKVGDKVQLVYLRDGERFEADVTLPERPILPADLQSYRMPQVSATP